MTNEELRNRATTSMNLRRDKIINRRKTQSKISNRSPPFDKVKFMKELQEKEDRNSKNRN